MTDILSSPCKLTQQGSKAALLTIALAEILVVKLPDWVKQVQYDGHKQVLVNFLQSHVARLGIVVELYSCLLVYRQGTLHTLRDSVV